MANMEADMDCLVRQMLNEKFFINTCMKVVEIVTGWLLKLWFYYFVSIC